MLRRWSCAGDGADAEYRVTAARSGTATVYVLQSDNHAPTIGDDVPAVVDRLLWHIFSDTIERSPDVLFVHAGVVAGPDGDGVLLPGPSGAGKSTLVTGLVRAGFGYLSDEAGAVDLDTGVLRPVDRPIALKEGARDIFPGLVLRCAANGVAHVAPDDLRESAPSQPCEVAHIVFPRYLPGARTRLAPLTAGQAFLELAGSTNELHRFGVRGVRRLMDLAQHSRSHRLVSGDLPTAVNAVRELLAA